VEARLEDQQIVCPLLDAVAEVLQVSNGAGDPGGPVTDRQADALAADVEGGGEQPDQQAAHQAEANVVGPREGAVVEPGDEGAGGQGRGTDEEEGGQGQGRNPEGPREGNAAGDPTHRRNSLSRLRNGRPGPVALGNPVGDTGTVAQNRERRGAAADPVVESWGVQKLPSAPDNLPYC
jgi:hypothetical protein